MQIMSCLYSVYCLIIWLVPLLFDSIQLELSKDNRTGVMGLTTTKNKEETCVGKEKYVDSQP